MNRNQLISMWCGIAAIVIMGLPTIGNRIRYSGFFLCVFLVALVTAGLIYTFKDQKAKNTLQDIRNEILEKSRLKMRKDDAAVNDREKDQKPENILQEIRNEILKKRQFKMRKDDAAVNDREKAQKAKA